jgi:CRISPR-associated protein Cas8b1/Cst1 subtype I-B
MEELEENSSSQIESNTILNIDEKITKLILETLLAQRKKRRPHNGNALCWFFLSVISNKKITNKVPQIMHCMYLMSYQTNDHKRS